MQYKDYTKYYPFIFVGLIVLGVVVSVITMVYVYIGVDDVQPTNADEIIEVKLPIMSWSQYSILSKKYENGIVLPEKKLMDDKKVTIDEQPKAALETEKVE